MVRYLIVRGLRVVLAVGGIVGIVFVVARLTGDPATMIFGLNATDAQIQAYRHLMGWDRPVYAQFAQFARAALQGDFGDSFYYTRDALGLVLGRLPATLELTGAAMFFAVGVGITSGVIAGSLRGTAWDAVTMSVAVLGRSVPVFWLALLLVYLFAVHWGVLPAAGRAGASSLILPGFSLGIVNAAEIARLTRSSMVEVMAQDFIRTGHAKGLSAARVVIVHALRNALVPVVTIVGLQLGTLLGGAVITETIFAWPGVGLLAVQAILRRDFPVLQASVFLLAIGFVAINVLLDVLYPLLDPRIARQA